MAEISSFNSKGIEIKTRDHCTVISTQALGELTLKI